MIKYQIMNKECSKCGVKKTLIDFSKSIGGKLGLRADCKSCVLDRQHRLVVHRLSDDIIRMCTKCKVEKIITAFQKVNSNISGYRTECTECRRRSGREYAKLHKKTNHRQYRKFRNGFKEKEHRRSVKKRTHINAEVKRIKSEPCTDCKKTFPYYCMDFDHLNPDDKIDSIKEIKSSPSITHVLNEIAKCELVCVNCHRVRSVNEFTHMSKVLQRVRNRGTILKAKDSPCVDCGDKFHPCAMDFDHVRGTKLYSIAQCASRFGKVKLLEEIAKCDLVCACCHRKRTYSRLVA